MAKLKLLSTVFSKLGSLTKNNGQIIATRDSKSLYIDLEGERIEITDWVDVDTEESLLVILSPLVNKYYYTKDTNKIWRYIGGEWKCLNASVNDLTPTYTESSTLVKLSSGEKLSVAFGKISKAITDLISHIGDSIKHITSAERTNWNAAKTHADSIHARTDATKVEKSSTNGNIKINGTETTVYTHPSGTNPHGTTKSDVGLGNVDNTKDIDKPISTQQQEKFDELSSNLDTLEFGEVAGGKNLFDGEFFRELIKIGVDYTQRNLKEEFVSIRNVKGLTYITFGGYFKKGTYTFSYTNDAWFSLNRFAIAGTYCIGTTTETVRKSYTWTQSIDGWTYFGIEGDDKETGTVDTPFSITPDIMIEKGSTATTPYEPYIPSVKMLADEVGKQNESLSVIGKCKNLLKPTLQTGNLNGVTCTNNEDGTYTLNGTVTIGDYVQFILLNDKIGAGTYKIIGNPDSSLGCSLYFNGKGGASIDYGKGAVVNFASDETIILYLYIPNGVTLTNVIFKPMLTTNLNATYDDFVPYTGDSETLTHDVAELKNDLATHTHNYAGSSSAGGSATSAVKLDTATAGSATQPVYFSGGKPVATTYTLGKSVPSDAVFTDTTYSNFIKSGSGAKPGLVPAPSTTAGTTKYLREDGTWSEPSGFNLSDILLSVYPVGSIYMSVKNINPGSIFGGTWVAWGSGRVPVGIDANNTNFNTVEKTGGASRVAITSAQMPSHTHTFTGSSSTTGSQSANHTHSGTTNETGGHSHIVDPISISEVMKVDGVNLKWSNAGGTGKKGTIASSGDKSIYINFPGHATDTTGSHSHTIATGKNSVSHHHTVTAKGSNSNTGNGEAHSNLQPYITCYMWKRTA